MGNKHTADGRWIVGNGNSGDDYKGFLHWRECYICLTESGATEESVSYLNALKEYALAHYALGEPIMPPTMTVWVVANGKATAVQADDVKVEDGDYTICGITYSNGAWDYSNAGQGGGGSSLPKVTEENNGDVLTVVDGEWGKGDPPYTVEEIAKTIVILQNTSITINSTGEASFGGFENAPASGDTLTVEWNGESYECVTSEFQEGVIKCGATGILDGNPDWSIYPFCLILPLVTTGGGVAIAEEKGSATIAITKTMEGKTITPSDDFKAAVVASVDSGSGIDAFVVTFSWDDNVGTDGGYVADKTYAECKAASDAGKMLFVKESSMGEKYGFAFANNYRFTGYRYEIGAGVGGKIISIHEYKIESNETISVEKYQTSVSPVN